MDVKVTKLCDMDAIAIPAEMLCVCVDEQDVEGDVARLGLRYAAESEADTVGPGDTVCCRADAESYPDGRAILLYTAAALPGAEAANAAAIGKSVGERFETSLAGKAVCLTVERIVRRTPAEVNDALVASLGLEGVVTVEDYRAWARDKRRAERRMEQSKEITRYLVDEMMAGSDFDFDAAALAAMVDEEMEQFAAEYAEEDADMSPEEMRAAIAEQIRQGWLAKAFCESLGLAIDRASAEEYTDQMLEMMKLMGDDSLTREAVLDMALQNEYFRAFYEYIDKLIERKMGE